MVYADTENFRGAPGGTNTLLEYALGIGNENPVCEYGDERFCAALIRKSKEPSLKNAYEMYESLRECAASDMFLAAEDEYVFCTAREAAFDIEDISRAAGAGADIVYDGPIGITELKGIFGRLKPLMELSFYTGTDGMIIKASDRYKNDLWKGTPVKTLLSGGMADLVLRLEREFSLLYEKQPPVNAAKEYCVSLYAGLAELDKRNPRNVFIRCAAQIAGADTLSHIKRVILETARIIEEASFSENAEGCSALISETIHIINDNIGNEELSLRWIAGNVLYANVDYLGKLFKKETGRNFSHYVMERRMELAKKTIVESVGDRIYEVAQKVGYGSNSQYFSQVFKKYTGLSPLEYKEYAKKIKQNIK